MECSACGAFYKERSATCPECGAKQIEVTPDHSQEVGSNQTEIKPTSSRKQANPAGRVRSTPSLIEFPGVTRHSLPEWRKELSDRVREAQERRARESALEASEISVEPTDKNGPLLELLPQTELPPMNPIVVAALRRIEKAHVPFNGNQSVAVVVEDQPDPEPNATVEETIVSPSVLSEDSSTNLQEPVERVHNLAVVPAPPVMDVPMIDEPVVGQTSDDPIIENLAPAVRPKPKRLIRDDLDPALNYLDSVPTNLVIDSSAYRSAPIVSRMAAAVIDLIVIGSLVAGPLALTGYINLDWNEPRLIGSVAGAVIAIGFLYLTINTAMTGRTLGMRLFSLRVVDARTGLIPTGKQSAGRAIVFLLSLASAGIVLLYTFVNSERHTPQDRFTRTTVVRA